MTHDKIPPIWYAIGIFFTVPLAATLFIATTAFMVIAWPVLPFLAYCKRKEEMQNPPNPDPFIYRQPESHRNEEAV